MIMIDRMRERLNLDKADSDVAAFQTLLYSGEMALKTVVAAMVASITDPKGRSQYRCLYRLVRADGIGEWADVLQGVLVGPTSQFLHPQARVEQKQLTENLGPGNWQHTMVAEIAAALRVLGIEVRPVGAKTQGKAWFDLFCTLRNKTRGHGALTATQASAAYSSLEASIRVLVANLGVFHRPWAFLHRNLSGKYRVSAIAGDQGAFLPLKSATSCSYANGVYLALCEEAIVPVELVESDAELSDFYFANGQFRSKSYELISYITNDKISA